jgi:hypothetical protein
VCAVAATACGGRYQKLPPQAVVSPPRAATGGEAALALLPAGADVVVEIDLARARANPLVGPVVDRWVGAAAALDRGGLPLGPPPPLDGAAWVVLAAYGIGGDDATTVTLLAPGLGVEVPGAVKLTDGIVALAPPAWIDRLRAVTAATSAAADHTLLALRGRAMPSEATGAVLRMTARLSADARIAFAGMLGVEPAPRAISAWVDVADDAAMVLDLDARDPSDPAATRRLRTALERLLHQIAARPEIRSLGLAPPFARTRIVAVNRSTWLRVVTHVSPGRLRWAVAQASGAAAPAPDEAPP